MGLFGRDESPWRCPVCKVITTVKRDVNPRGQDRVIYQACGHVATGRDDVRRRRHDRTSRPR